MSGTTFDGSDTFAEALFAQITTAFNNIQAGATQPAVTISGTGTLPALDSGYGEVVVGSALTAAVTLPASYPVVFDEVASATTLVGGGGVNQAVFAAAGGLTYDINGGAGVIETGNVGATLGDTIFIGGAEPGYVAAGEGADTVVVLSGTNYIALGAGANTLFLDGGSNLVGAEGANEIVVGTDSTAAAGSATISLSGATTIDGGASSLLLLNGAGTAFLLPQTDSTTGAQTNTGSATVFGGTGGGAFYGGTDGNNLMLAGDQATTLIGGGANDQLFAWGGGDDQLQAVGGNSFLIGGAGSGNNTFFAGAGDTEATGGSGQDIFVAGTGNATLLAGSGADQFDFTSGQAGGVDVIFGFKAGIDQVNLFGYDTDNSSAGIAALNQTDVNAAGGSTFFVLSDNTTVFFVGVTTLPNNAIVG